MKKIAIVSMVAALLFGATACSGYNDEHGWGDAPVSGKKGDDAPAEVFNMPDQFGNLATKCVGHGYRAFVTTSASGHPSNLVIVSDEDCR